jgi:hypothetical protein
MNMTVSLTIAKILKRTPILSPLARRFNAARHRAISEKIFALCSQAENATTATKQPVASNGGPIWLLWWQGEEQAPDIVRACIASIHQHKGNRRVIVLTRNNIREFVQLPDYIYSKLDAGNITLTHFSDIVRFNLLRHYGGLWMDATLFVSKPLDTSRYFGQFFTCCGYLDPSYFSVTKGQWTGFFIGGSSEEPLFTFMDNFFQSYWRENDDLIDYFLIDYALEYARAHRIGSLANWINEERGEDNPRLFDLARYIARPFDQQVWDELNRYTGVYKLSWKKLRHYPKHSFGDVLLSPYLNNH